MITAMQPTWNFLSTMVDIFLRGDGYRRHDNETRRDPGATGKQPGPPPPCGGTPIGMPPDEITKINCVLGSITVGAIMRKKGSRNTLVKIDYDLIGELAGIAGGTAKRYAHRGEYDPRSLDSVLRWVIGRLAAKGVSLIGVPPKNAPDAEGMT
jgi:hypothetical protein